MAGLIIEKDSTTLRTYLYVYTKDGDTPLWIACEAGHLSIDSLISLLSLLRQRDLDAETTRMARSEKRMVPRARVHSTHPSTLRCVCEGRARGVSPVVCCLRLSS